MVPHQVVSLLYNNNKLTAICRLLLKAGYPKHTWQDHQNTIHVVTFF
jgi:AMMECR1 domain-containing protein